MIGISGSGNVDRERDGKENVHPNMIMIIGKGAKPAV